MAKEEHERLVTIIKGVHQKLRQEYTKNPVDENLIWETHCKEVDLRHQYSQAMLKLATTVWSKNNSRIIWVHKLCRDYFYEGRMAKIMEKRWFCQNRMDACKDQLMDESSVPEIHIPFQSKISMLDVGSCYNPFSSYHEFDCLAVDLTPATKDVYQCDFLQLEVAACNMQLKLSNPLMTLPAGTFHVVLFSLVLEYLPSPHQRFKFCQKAWSLLQFNGLLLIITPDSKTQNHNAIRMRSWRQTLESIGFKRIVYEKQTHIHCMAFMKIYLPKERHDEENFQGLLIPQDFAPLSENEPVEILERTEEEDKNMLLCFSELPYPD